MAPMLRTRGSALDGLVGRARTMIRRTGYDITRASGSFPGHLQRLFHELQIDLVVDVGANRGQYGRFLRTAVGYRGAILSYEPVASAFDALAAVAAADGRWVAERMAIGATDGSLAINVAAADDLSSFLLPSQLGRAFLGEALGGTRQESVRVTRLEAVLGAYDPEGTSRVFVKVDTQGYEAEVLGGLGDRATAVAAIQLELPTISLYEGMMDYAQLLTITNDMGFVVTGLFPITPVNSFAAVDLDCVTVRRDLIEGGLGTDGNVPPARRTGRR